MARTRQDAAELDGRDDLGGFRDRFDIPDDGLLYMDGNSLGRPPKSTAERVQHVVREEWARGLVGSWNTWIDLGAQAGDLLARRMLGAAPGEVMISDSATVNLFKLAYAAVDARRGRNVIVTDAANFPTDRYVLQGIAAERGMTVRYAPDDPSADEVSEMMDPDVALVMLSHVAYRSGALLDMRSITSVAHEAGALALWDLSHSVGAVPVDLSDAGVDLAVGCTYKYLNGGPGAPAFLYVREPMRQSLRQPIQGWFGAANPFLMQHEYVPGAGIERFLAGTPPILSLVAAIEGIRISAEAGIDRIRAKSLRLTDLLIELVDDELAELGFTLATPRPHEVRGSHIALRHDDAWRICQALTAEANVVPDFREPDVVRLGLAPLYTRHVDVWDAVERLGQVVAERRFEKYPLERSRIV